MLGKNRHLIKIAFFNRVLLGRNTLKYFSSRIEFFWIQVAVKRYGLFMSKFAKY